MSNQTRTSKDVLFTIGYEGKTIDSFLSLLTEHSVTVLVDVRELPLSRKVGFSKTQLHEVLAGRGIEYVPMRSLGSPRELRYQLRDHGDYASFFGGYQEYLSQQRDSLDTLVNLLGKRALCLMCYEADPAKCHRSAIASALVKAAGSSLEIQHL